MNNTAINLRLCESILALIEHARIESGDQKLADNVERAVLDNQFLELEREIMDNPGAIEPWLIRRRRGHA
jgi:hypothetical protein